MTETRRARPAPGPASDSCGKYVRETDGLNEITCERVEGHRGRCACPVGYLDLLDWQEDEIARLRADRQRLVMAAAVVVAKTYRADRWLALPPDWTDALVALERALRG